MASLLGKKLGRVLGWFTGFLLAFEMPLSPYLRDIP
jgi:hypothetical protein